MSNLDTRQIISLAHVLAIGPLILYVSINSFNKQHTGQIANISLLALASVAVLYHLYRLYKGGRGSYWRYINAFHLLIGSLLLAVTISQLNKTFINPVVYTLMFILGAGAITYHLYLLTIGKK